MFAQTEVFFSLDVETNGPHHDLLEGGIVAFDHKGHEIGHYRFAITPSTPGAPATNEWLKNQLITMPDGTSISVLENATKNGKPATVAMEEVTNWCMDMVKKNGSTGNLICFPSAFDGHYWTNYCMKYNTNGYQNFLDRFPKARKDPDGLNYRDPFGFNHIDGQSYAMGKLGLTSRQSLKQLRQLFFTTDENAAFDKTAHDALNDARHQGQLFFRIATGRPVGSKI